MKKVIVLLMFFLLFAIQLTAQKPYCQNGKYGALYNDGKILTELKYDSVFIPEFDGNTKGGNLFLLTKISNKYGIIIFPSDTLPIIIEPKFDAIFQQKDYIIVEQNNKYGFIVYSSRYGATDAMKMFSDYRVWMKNVFISEIEYDKINDCHLFKGNKCGFIFLGEYGYISGKTIHNYRIIPAIYDSLIYYNNSSRLHSLAYPTYKKFEKIEDDDQGTNAVNYYAIKIIKNGFVNYLTINSSIADRPMHTLFLNNTYKDKELFYVEDGLFIINQLGKPLQLYNVVDSTYKIITDEQGKTLILDKYFRFRGDRCDEEDSVCLFYGESPDEKEFITIFTNVNKKENSLIFIDSERPDYDDHFTSIFKYKYNQVIGWNDSYYGADNQIIQSTPFTAFISKITSYKVDGILMRDFSLISFPDKKVVYNASFNSKNETIKINYPKPEKLDCCCPYFQIVKFTTKDDKYNTIKKQVLGYINYKTFQFSKKKPAGCQDDKNEYKGEMYKE